MPRSTLFRPNYRPLHPSIVYRESIVEAQQLHTCSESARHDSVQNECNMLAFENFLFVFRKVIAPQLWKVNIWQALHLKLIAEFSRD